MVCAVSLTTGVVSIRHCFIALAKRELGFVLMMLRIRQQVRWEHSQHEAKGSSVKHGKWSMPVTELSAHEHHL